MAAEARRQSYSGATKDESTSMFESDAAEAAKHDWHPVEETWAGATLVVVYELRASSESVPPDAVSDSGEPPRLFADADDDRPSKAPTKDIDRPHTYMHDAQTGTCRLCGRDESAVAHRGNEETRVKWVPMSQRRDMHPKPSSGTDPRVVWLLGIIAVAVVGGVFWVIATPHEQCYIGEPTRVSRLTSDVNGNRPNKIGGVRHPIEKTGESTYRGIPSQFRDDGYIAADAAIECGWELGKPYRLFGA